ncbi:MULTISPECIES: hypothetical protein [Bradyrhizobium]|uniref:hypothetical protein n=1 Tax=Bradyrhizobium TaxID=374 RepID=UPI000484157A|nr:MULTISPECIES: hypothetical protein [Bradyrhizobium]UFW51494.1 hypothetical protein BaraCB756_11190 [Bradyrhizobium arachidis]
MPSFESWMGRLHLNLHGPTLLPQDLFPEFKAASVVTVDMTFISNLAAQPFPSTAIASRVKAAGCLLT